MSASHQYPSSVPVHVFKPRGQQVATNQPLPTVPNDCIITSTLLASNPARLTNTLVIIFLKNQIGTRDGCQNHILVKILNKTTVAVIVNFTFCRDLSENFGNETYKNMSGNFGNETYKNI